MIVLNDNTFTLVYVQAGAKTSLDGTGLVSWEDVPNAPNVGNDNLPLPGSAKFTTNGTSVVTICAAPPKNYRRIIKSIFLNNSDTGSITLSISLYDGTTTSTFFKGTRATLEQLSYENGLGWKAYSVALVAQ